MSKKTNESDFDPAFIISQTKGRRRQIEPYSPPDDSVPANETEQEPEEVEQEQLSAQPDTRKRKNKQPDYESLFIRDATCTTRSGKAVYIRKEFHDRITRIAQVIGRNELSLFSYIDNVLEHHFASFQEDIEELYGKRNKGVF